MYLTWLDNNSWLIELENQHILVDPWLVGPLVFANAEWLFKGVHVPAADGSRPLPRPIPENIDLILLSQGLPDHAHPDTLQALDRNIPVVGSPSAAKVAREIRYSQVTELKHGEITALGDEITIQAVPGAPIGPFTVENGYILRGQRGGTSLYYEPHGFHSPTLQKVGPIDVVITPLSNLELPLVGPVIKGKNTALELAKWLTPQIMLPTAAGGDVAFEGMVLSALKVVGTGAEMQAVLSENHLSTKVLEPRAGDRFQVPLAVSA